MQRLMLPYNFMATKFLAGDSPDNTENTLFGTFFNFATF